VKILFDQGTPVPLRHALKRHVVVTAHEMDWARLANGALIEAAEAHQFEVLVTTDKNLRYQQNLTERKIAIFVLPYASWPRLQNHTDALAMAITALSPGDFVEWIIP
jgi:hypothetical protein